MVILRGQKVLKVDKFDYSLHPEAQKLIPCKAIEHIPKRTFLAASVPEEPEPEPISEYPVAEI